MKLFAALVGAGSLLAGSAVLAQDAPGPAGPGPADPGPAAPGPAAPSAEAQPGAQANDFSDAEIQSFAEAAVQIQELASDPAADQAAIQEQAEAIVAESGLTPESYNEIAQATQSDPEVAERVQLAVASMQGGPGG